jgi:hypothetical protein
VLAAAVAIAAVVSTAGVVLASAGAGTAEEDDEASIGLSCE